MAKEFPHQYINVELPMADFFEDGLQFHEHISQKMINNLNVEQKHIFNDINETMDGRGVQKDALFYIDGFGGTGKTFLYECLYHYQKSKNKRINAVAWTGIAAILLPTGKTAHRIFKLPLHA